MSYAQRQPIDASWKFAIAFVALTHASLGYAIVTGLAYTEIQKAAGSVKTFIVEEVRPPPPELHHAPQNAPEGQPRVVARPSSVRIDLPPLPVAPTMLEDLPPVTLPAAAPAQPAPTYAVQSSASSPANERIPPRSATGDLQSLFRSADYPPAALEREEQGSVTVQLTVGVMGRVRACEIATSSGSRTLDNVSCQILKSRAFFTPARDSSGNLTIDTVRQEIRWVLHQARLMDPNLGFPPTPAISPKRFSCPTGGQT